MHAPPEMQKPGAPTAVEVHRAQQKNQSANENPYHPCNHTAGFDRVDRIATALGEFTHWVINPHPLGKGSLNPKAVAQRAIMAAWVVRPDIVKGRTLTDLAAILATKPEVLSRQASSFSRRFGIKGRCQYSERTRSSMRRARLRLNSGDRGGDNESV